MAKHFSPLGRKPSIAQPVRQTFLSAYCAKQDYIVEEIQRKICKSGKNTNFFKQFPTQRMTSPNHVLFCGNTD
jgi:hypothetical protein